jgi:hypothetical protein
MCSNSRQRIFLAGLFALYGFAALHCAWAEPPLVKFAVTVSREAVPVSHQLALDLRPPPEIQAGDPIARSESQAVAPSRRSFATVTAPMSPVEDVARDFRRQGLPVAKLFQNGNLMVHLGLSPKGKMGLWFVHQLH